MSRTVTDDVVHYVKGSIKSPTELHSVFVGEIKRKYSDGSLTVDSIGRILEDKIFFPQFGWSLGGLLGRVFLRCGRQRPDSPSHRLLLIYGPHSCFTRSKGRETPRIAQRSPADPPPTPSLNVSSRSSKNCHQNCNHDGLLNRPTTAVIEHNTPRSPKRTAPRRSKRQQPLLLRPADRVEEFIQSLALPCVHSAIDRRFRRHRF